MFTSKIQFLDQIWTKGESYQGGVRSQIFLKSVHPNWRYGFFGPKWAKTGKWLWRSHFLTDFAENFWVYRELKGLSIKILKSHIGPFVWEKTRFSANLWLTKNLFTADRFSILFYAQLVGIYTSLLCFVFCLLCTL